MKKILAFVLTLTLIFCCVPFGAFNITAFAETSGTTGECTWTLDGGVLTISGNGKMADYTDTAAPWGFSSNSVYAVVIEEGVTNIGDKAFDWQTFLYSITIPSSVKSIGNEAFSNCIVLTDIELPNSLETVGDNAFYNCISLYEIIIPNSVTTIGDRAFYHCKDASNIVIGNCLKSIGNEAFRSCESVKNIIVPDSVTSIGDDAFDFCNALESITLGNGIEEIGESAFYICPSLSNVYIDNLTSWCSINFKNEYSNPFYCAENFYVNNELVTDLVIPEDVEVLHDYVFSNSAITSVTISNSVKSIGYKAFASCKFLNSVTIGNGVNDIAGSVFYCCYSLENVTLGNSIKNIGSHAFDCQSIKNVYINDLAAYCNIEFYNYSANPVYYADNLFYNGEKVNGEMVIPNGVKKIPNYAFYKLGITSVTIPESVESIGDYAFYYCSKIDSVNLGNGVNSIGKYAFAYCNAILELIIPDSVEYIDDSAFYNCTNIKNITLGKGIKTVGDFAFSVLYNLENLYINDLAAYCNIEFKNSNPNQYAQKIYLNGEELKGDLIIPIGVEKIPSYAFADLKITSVTIPNTVKIIGESAFENCDLLESVEIPDSVEIIETKAFKNCYEIKNVEFGNGLSVIGEEAFRNCNLENVTIPESVVEIKGYPFIGCDLLNNIFVSENNKNYSSDDGVLFNKEKTVLIEFPGGKSGDNYVIPSSVTAINELAFSECLSIYKINIPNNVKTIGTFAFYGCAHLNDISISNEIEKIGKAAFSYTGYWRNSANWNNDGLYIGKHLVEVKSYVIDFVIKKGTLTIADALFEINYNLKSVEIPNSLRRISDNAFSACYNLENLKMGNGIISIGNSAFSSCQGLTEIIIPNSVETIGEKAFNFCDELLSVTIPKSVTYIGAQAFDLCAELKTVNYGGSEEDRLNINIGAENYDLTEAVWNYNYVYELKYENGDINGDSEVNAADLGLLKKILAELILLDDAQVKCTEVDEISGTPNAADLALLKKMIAELV